MSAQNPLDIWRVETPEGIFETDLETLRQWIREDCVLPGDKVAKGNLHWIEAGRVPLLRAAFGSKLNAPAAAAPPAQTVAAAPAQTVTAGQAIIPAPPVSKAASAASHAWQPTVAPPPAFAPQANSFSQPGGGGCVNHPYAPPHVVCRACSATFCRDCPKYVNKIPICTVCGDLCKPFKEMRQKAMLQQSQLSGFGLNEFALALAYPFRHPFSVLLMAIIYAFLSLLGMKGQIIACGIPFGSMSHVINQFAWGATNCGLYPSFESFSWWDNAIRPMFLSIGIYIITFGPVIVISLAIIYGALTLATPAQQSPAAQPPPTPMQDQRSEMTQRDIDGLLHKADPGYPAPKPVVPETPQPTPAQMKTQKKGDDIGSALMGMGLSGAALVLILVAVGWALFYYPMALTIAGYTEDFWAVVNPKVGLDTMRRMGWNYVKAFFMYLFVQIPALFVMLFLYIALAPFNLPFFGNLPAAFMSGIVTFITSLVIACILGFALFKSGDKLDIRVA
ncbi:MAG: hypothetical protein JOZ52_09600 [Acidobacteria bacterium]|nr:hypothetical protein [Acidobacteriota bacterium]